ncbi:MAG TPA: DUF86 domain-containing protein [Spirochaetota bacterium]|jgi:uncharacterized protein with HEPN domain|nr:MAG: hypothetical protein BWX91_02074 [Spirochaetes bacterium ADurb.Bin133]HNZ27858.1 DUF86 domain-containing protein [Spirochaetota bacterium]HPY88605.1 DUF86 domain-containing protein [Spirochaetota bacterium]
MSERDWTLFIEDILESIDLIDKYISNITLEDFKDDRKTQDAVIRNLEVIGEALKNIPVEIRDAHSDVDWKGFIGLRNIIIHQYFGISLPILWTIITKDIKNLKTNIESIKFYK